MVSILGISAFYHDSAAALLIDGRLVAAAQEERFSRRKHDARFPESAIAYCLSEANLAASRLDFIAFYEKPLRKLERIVETHVAHAPRGLRQFLRAMPAWLANKLDVGSVIRRRLGSRSGPCQRPVFVAHHESHAARAFYPSPFDEAAILTSDGVGEWATACLGIGRGNRVRLTRELRFPHSLGLLYSAATAFCGFRVNADEYKLMGLAPYGRPRIVDALLANAVDLKADGSLRLNMDYFPFCHRLAMTSRRFERLMGGKPRRAGEPITERDADLAASVQWIVEESVLRMARFLHATHPARAVCLAGGVALNCAANGRLIREGPFEQVWVQPAAGDAGGAIGAAWFVWHQLLERPRRADPVDSMSGALLGPSYSSGQVAQALDREGAVARRVPSPGELDRLVAAWIDEGKTVGWFQGRMEFGPSALGSRSILADARRAGMRDHLNRCVKDRESFRPFAPAILRGPSVTLFPAADRESNAYMTSLTHAARVDPPAVNSAVPAVTHVDHSARAQLVDSAHHPRFASLLRAFFERTGCPAIVNTSFNTADEPIVCSPEEAYRTGGLDRLVIEDHVLLKEEQSAIRNRDTAVRGRTGPMEARSGAARSALRGAYRLGAGLSRTVAGLVSLVALAAVHSLLITPIGLIRRACGDDPLDVRSSADRATYWRELPEPADPVDYWRPF